jgi:hypothetical protein
VNVGLVAVFPASDNEPSFAQALQTMPDDAPNELTNKAMTSDARRPGTSHRLRWWLVGAAVAPFLAAAPAALQVYLYHREQPKPSRNITAELNVPILAIPENERAWPRYREIIAKIKDISPLSSNVSEEFDRTTELGQLLIRSILDQARPQLAAARFTATMPDLGFVLSVASDGAGGGIVSSAAGANPIMLNVLLGHVEQFRWLENLLILDAEYAVDEGKGALAADDLLATISMTDQLLETRPIVVQMASWRLLGRSMNVLRNLLANDPRAIPADRLDALAKRLARYARGGPIEPVLDAERLLFVDAVQRTFTDDGNGDGYFYAPAAMQLLGDGDPSPWMMVGYALSRGQYSSRRQIQEEFDWRMDEAQVACRRPLWQTADLPAPPPVECRSADGKWHMLLALFMSPLEKMYFSAQSTTQERDATLVVIALARFFDAHGHWPDSLDELTPAYLQAVPPDRFTGDALCYRLIDEQPVVYSVGPDRDDDGGKPIADAPTFDLETAWVSPSDAALAGDGDWVLWRALTNVAP